MKKGWMQVSRLLRVFLVISVVCGVLYLYLPPIEREGRYTIASMNQTVGENMVDVACIGSSHVYAAINPVQVYRDTGIAAYDVAQGGQAPWQSYYYLKAVDKYQDPALIVLDVFMFAFGPSRFIEKDTVSNLLHYPFSLDKWRALLVSDEESPLNIMLVFPYTYDEYAYFWRHGFTKDKIGDQKDLRMGYQYRSEVNPKRGTGQLLDAVTVEGSTPIYEKNEKYLRRFIKYCQNHDLDLLLIHTPYLNLTEDGQRKYNYIGGIAGEYGVPYLDGGLYMEEMGLDSSTDSFDYGEHLNYSGVVKYTEWFEAYLSEHYELQDHREEPEYHIYEEAIEALVKDVEGKS